MSKHNIDNILKSLESHYKEKDYKAAEELLLKSRDDFSVGEFSFYLGTLRLKQGDYASGRLHLEKSFKLGHITDESVNNLNAARQMSFNNGVQELKGFEKSFVTMSTWPASFSINLSLALFIIFLGVILYKKIKSIWIFVCLLLLASTPTALHQLYFKDTKVGVIIKETPLMEGPSAIFENFGQIPAGTRLMTSKQNDGWLFIRYPKELSGWVEGSNVGLY